MVLVVAYAVIFTVWTCSGCAHSGSKVISMEYSTMAILDPCPTFLVAIFPFAMFTVAAIPSLTFLICPFLWISLMNPSLTISNTDALIWMEKLEPSLASFPWLKGSLLDSCASFFLKAPISLSKYGRCTVTALMPPGDPSFLPGALTRLWSLCPTR